MEGNLDAPKSDELRTGNLHHETLKRDTADRPMTALEIALQEQAASQNGLRDQVETLAGRLNPVLRTKYAFTDEGKDANRIATDKEPTIHSSVVNQIQAMTARNFAAQDVVLFLLENLEV